MATYKTLAIVDDVHTCDCCGKSNLKLTVAMERDDGDILHFGSVCATRHSGREAKVIRKEAATELQMRKAAATREVRVHPTFDAYQEKLNEARSLGLCGVAFLNFCETARNAQEAAQQAICDAAGFRFYEICA